MIDISVLCFITIPSLFLSFFFARKSVVLYRHVKKSGNHVIAFIAFHSRTRAPSPSSSSQERTIDFFIEKTLAHELRQDLVLI